MRRARCFSATLLLTLLAAAMVGTVRAEDPAEPLIDELFRLSGTTKLVGEIPGLVSIGMQMAQQENPVDPKELAELQKAAEEQYSAERFMHILREHVGKKIDQEKIGKLIDWYKGELAQRVIKAEEDNSKPDKIREMQTYVASLAQNPLPESRLTLLKRLDAAIRGSAINENMLLKVRMSMVRASNAIVPEATRQSEEQLKKTEERLAAEVKKVVEQQLLGSWAFSYRDISDADFETYVAFYETELGRAWGISLGEALSIAMEQAGSELVAHCAERLKKSSEPEAPLPASAPVATESKPE